MHHHHGSLGKREGLLKRGSSALLPAGPRPPWDQTGTWCHPWAEKAQPTLSPPSLLLNTSSRECGSKSPAELWLLTGADAAHPSRRHGRVPAHSLQQEGPGHGSGSSSLTSAQRLPWIPWTRTGTIIPWQKPRAGKPRRDLKVG